MATTNNFTFGVDAHPFTLNFPFIDEDNLVVTLDGVVKTLDTDYTVINKTSNTAAGVGFLSGAQIQFTASPLPTTGAVKVVRNTTLETTSTFKTGSAIRAIDLNSNFTQNLYVTEEISNNAILTDGSNAFDGDLNMGGNQITNLGTPATDSDAVTKLYVDSRFSSQSIPGYTRWRTTATASQTVFSGVGESGGTLAYSATRENVYVNGALQQRTVDYTADNGTTITFIVGLQAGDIVDVVCVNNVSTVTSDQSSEVYFLQSGTGATTRTVESKLKDVVSVKDFGAVGDGVTDDTDAFTNARAEAKSNGKLLLVPVGNYLISGTVYSVTGSFVFSDDSFAIPINIGQQATNNSMLYVASTPNTTPIDSNDGRVPISVSVETNGAQHGECYRGNIFNKSTDGQGNPAFYGKLVNYTTSGIGWAHYGETRHNGGTSIGAGVECAGYTTSGSMIGVNVQNTTGSTPDVHPEDSSSSDAQPVDSKGIQIIGGPADLNKWAYGIYFSPNSIQSTGTGIDFTTSTYDTGINCAAATFNVAPIRLGDGQNITLESTNAIKFGYNSAATGGAAIEFNNAANTNLRLYNSGILDVLGSIRPITNDGSNLGSGTKRFAEGHIRKVVLANSTNLAIQFGAGSPETVVTGGVGSLYLRTDGGAGTTLYIKESGTGNTGWVAK